MSDNGVCRTALATAGLFNIGETIFFFKKYIYIFFLHNFIQISLRKIQKCFAYFSVNFHLWEDKLYWKAKSQQSSRLN